MRRHPFSAVNLISDPIHGYIELTKRLDPADGGRRSACRTRPPPRTTCSTRAWVQRLRRISQLQSARWVFPTAEHSRFTHGLGVMHEAGLWARHLYPTLRTALVDVEPATPPAVRGPGRRDAPGRRAAPRRRPRSVRPLLRRPRPAPTSRPRPTPAGRAAKTLSHEDLVPADRRARARRRSSAASAGRRGSCRSATPSRPGEAIDPRWVAFLVSKPALADPAMPRWVRWLQPLLSGVFTVDNLDYVRRDAYLTGVAVGPVDVERLRRYSFVGERGLTLYEPGLGALEMFLDGPPVHVPPGLLPPDRPGDRPRPRPRSSGRASGRSSATARRPTPCRPTPTSTSTPCSTRPPCGPAARPSPTTPRPGDGTVTPADRRRVAGDPPAPAALAVRGRGPGRLRAGRLPDGARRRRSATAEPGRVAIDLATVDARPAEATDDGLAARGRGPRRPAGARRCPNRSRGCRRTRSSPAATDAE